MNIIFCASGAKLVSEGKSLDFSSESYSGNSFQPYPPVINGFKPIHSAGNNNVKAGYQGLKPSQNVAFVDDNSPKPVVFQ